VIGSRGNSTFESSQKEKDTPATGAITDEQFLGQGGKAKKKKIRVLTYYLREEEKH